LTEPNVPARNVAHWALLDVARLPIEEYAAVFPTMKPIVEQALMDMHRKGQSAGAMRLQARFEALHLKRTQIYLEHVGRVMETEAARDLVAADQLRQEAGGQNAEGMAAMLAEMMRMSHESVQAVAAGAGRA
jgi:hypothetical protein